MEPEPATAQTPLETLQTPRKRRKRGRPTVFDQQKRHGFCIMIQMGCSVRAAASHLGIDKKSVEYARRHDPEFDAEVRSAEHSRNMNLLSHVVSAGSRSWRASAWLLAAVQPELYAAHSRRRGGAATPVARNEQRLKRFVMRLVVEVMTDCIQNQAKHGRDFFAQFRPPQTSPDSTSATAPNPQTKRNSDGPQTDADLAVAAIDERLAEIEAESKGPPKQYPALETLFEDPEQRKILREHIARLKNQDQKKSRPKHNPNHATEKQQPRSA